jgi:hypothetical protein
MTALPAPEQWVLKPMTELELAEEIEKWVEFVDKNGRPVRLPMVFVRAFLTRDDSLDTVVAIATMPIILADGVVLALPGDGDFDPLRGIDFHIQPEVMATVPRREDCTPSAVRDAMKFLTDEWLCDVATDYDGKCVLITAALTLIERSLLPQRPVFFVTAGKRGSGKTTALTMLIIAVTGIWPAAAAWSKNEEERRKAIFSYFLYGVPYILWDNIERGSQISCTHIEKSCTSAYYADRRLGVSEMVATAASTIHLFTGNNVSPKGDLASRSLMVRLEVDRADPENREFTHPDPIAWTERNRAELLRAFYTILLGNPTLDKPRDAMMNTRYKMWYRVVGSAVEHAAKQTGHAVDFRKLFQARDEEDEEATSLAEMLGAAEKTWTSEFQATNMADACNSDQNLHRDTFRSFFAPDLGDDRKVSAVSVGKRLKQRVGEPVQSGGRTLILKVRRDRTNSQFYRVEAKSDAEDAEHA